jgi:hypothetical protein
MRPQNYESLIMEISRLPLGSLRTKSDLDVAPIKRCKIYYKGEGGDTFGHLKHKL